MSLTPAQRRLEKARAEAVARAGRSAEILGVVDDEPKGNTVSVAVPGPGGPRYSVTFKGTAPEVGASVRISRNGPDFSIVMAGGGTGTTVGPPPVPLPTPTPSADLNRLVLDGHSWSDGSVTLDGTTLGGQNLNARRERLDQYLANLFGLAWPEFSHIGRAGSMLTQDGFARTLALIYPQHNGVAPHRATAGNHAMLTLINDVGNLGDPGANGGQMLRVYQMAMRTAIARRWAGRVYENTDAAIAYSGTWVNPTPSVQVSGDSVAVTSQVGAALTWTVPADYAGTHVSLRFRGEVGANGCTAFTIVSPGNANVVQSTNNVLPASIPGKPGTPTFGTVNVRLPLKPTGATQTITVTGNSYTGGGVLAFDCAEIEDANPPMMAWALGAKPRDWYVYEILSALGGVASNGVAGGARRTGSVGSPTSTDFKNVAASFLPLGAQPGDAWLSAYNLGTLQVISEFATPATATDVTAMPKPCFAVDIRQDINGRAHVSQWGDWLHPNGTGNLAMALRFFTTITTASLTTEQLATPYAARDAAMFAASVRR